MPRKEYGFDVRDAAESLYVDSGLTYGEIAGKTGVAVNTLKNWGNTGDWKDRKRQRVQTRKTLQENLEKLRVRAMESALAGPDVDPQKMFAVIRMEKLALDREHNLRQALEKGPDNVDRPRMFLEALEFVADFLKSRDPEGLKVLAQNFDGLVTRFKEKHAQAA